jgi:hypothetical protein
MDSFNAVFFRRKTYFFISVFWLVWGVFHGWLVSRLFGLGGDLGFVLVFSICVDDVEGVRAKRRCLVVGCRLSIGAEGGGSRRVEMCLI